MGMGCGSNGEVTVFTSPLWIPGDSSELQSPGWERKELEPRGSIHSIDTTDVQTCREGQVGKGMQGVEDEVAWTGSDVT
jgi:hypothetical protein